MEQLPTPGEAEQTLLRRNLPFKRRREPRYRCPLATSARMFRTDVTVPEEVVWLANMSRHGLSFLRTQALDPGIPVLISIPSPNQSLPLQATVVHASRQANGDWLIGCELLQPLDADVLESYLSQDDI
jgi:hypothetical protein